MAIRHRQTENKRLIRIHCRSVKSSRSGIGSGQCHLCSGGSLFPKIGKRSRSSRRRPVQCDASRAFGYALIITCIGDGSDDVDNVHIDIIRSGLTVVGCDRQAKAIPFSAGPDIRCGKCCRRRVCTSQGDSRAASRLCPLIA